LYHIAFGCGIDVVSIIALDFCSVMNALSAHGDILASFGQNVLPVALPAAVVLGAALIGVKFLYPSIRRAQSTAILSEKPDKHGNTEAARSDSAAQTEGGPEEEKFTAVAETNLSGDSASSGAPSVGSNSSYNTTVLLESGRDPVENEVKVDHVGSETVGKPEQVSSENIGEGLGKKVPTGVDSPGEGALSYQPAIEEEEHRSEVHPSNDKIHPLAVGTHHARAKKASSRGKNRSKGKRASGEETASGNHRVARKPFVMQKASESDNPFEGSQLSVESGPSGGSDKPLPPRSRGKEGRHAGRSSRVSKRTSKEDS
jgi:hypothetical protein